MIIERRRTTFWSEEARNKRATGCLVFCVLVLTSEVIGGIAYLVQPEFWWAGALGGLFLALILFTYVAQYGPKQLIQIAGARDADPEEQRRMIDVGHEMAIAAGIPVPKFYVTDDPSINAFSVGFNPSNAAVCFTTGALEKLNRDELQGVMAHEISHIKNYDTRLMTMLALTLGLLVVIRSVFLRSGGLSGRDRGRSGAGGILVLILVIVAPILTMLINLATSRKREFLADATAAQLTRYPDGLADALEKIEADSSPPAEVNAAISPLFISSPAGAESDSAFSLFSTHPSTRERIARLRSMGLINRDAMTDQPPTV